MKQREFVFIKCGDEVLTVYKGQVVKMKVVTIYDNGRQKRSVVLAVPDSKDTILRHMYNIYTIDLDLNGRTNEKRSQSNQDLRH